MSDNRSRVRIGDSQISEVKQDEERRLRKSNRDSNDAFIELLLKYHGNRETPLVDNARDQTV